MTTSVEDPAGFPGCRECPLLAAGSSTVCYSCARQTFVTATHPCPVCSQDLGEPGRGCRNKLCHRTDRSIVRIQAIAALGEPLRQQILRFKYDGKAGWGPIFGRILLGYLQQHHKPQDFDLIVANPTFQEAGSVRLRHTEVVLDAAAKEDWFDEWPFDTGEPRALVKSAATPKSATGSYANKETAADALLDALSVDRLRTAGARILVYDDVCTTGLQLDRVARVLREHGGATHVEGLVLARTQWWG